MPKQRTHNVEKVKILIERKRIGEQAFQTYFQGQYASSKKYLLNSFTCIFALFYGQFPEWFIFHLNTAILHDEKKTNALYDTS